MSRPIDKKCLTCSGLTIEEAILLHSESGDGCWNPKICHSRRSHYKKRSENNYKRRQLRTNSKIDRVEVPQPTVYSTVLVLYRDRKDAPVHAVAAQIWQGNKQVAEVPPTHCIGLNGRQVRDYLQGVLAILKQKNGVLCISLGIFFNNYFSRFIVNRSIIAWSLFLIFYWYFNSAVAFSPNISTNISPEQVTFIYK